MSNYIHQGGLPQNANLFDNAGRNAGSNDSDGWFVSYADILLLLLTFFVLLFAFSRVERLGNSIEGSEPTDQAIIVTTEHNKVVEVQTPETAIEPITPVMAVVKEDSVAVIHAAVDIVASEVDNASEVVADNAVKKAEAAPVVMAIVETEERDRVESITEGQEVVAKVLPEPVNEVIAKVMHKTAVPDEIAVGLKAPSLLAEASLEPLTVDEQLAKLTAGLTSNEVEISTGYQSINIELNNKVLFPLGKAQLLVEGQVFLDEIAAIMANNDYYASIEGHTDNTPISTAQFPSNWELSSARATTVARYLIGQGVEATRLRAIGYADTQPKRDNVTQEGRARNRRVSITFHYDRAAPLS